METFLEHYWPHILAAISFLLGATAAIHAAMTKDEVRAAIGWVGVGADARCMGRPCKGRWPG